MFSEAYDAWVSIYNDEIQLKWKSERLEIRKLSMIFCAFQNELMKLKTELNDELQEVRSLLRRRDIKQKCQNFKGLVESEHFGELIDNDHENKLPQVPFQDKTNQNDFLIASPTTEKFSDQKINSPDFLNKTVTSPVLNRSLSRFKRKKTSPKYQVVNSRSATEVNKTPINLNNSNILESSVIDETPVAKPKRKRPKKTNKFKPNGTKTLTQFFLEPKKIKKEIDSNLPSMDIDQMIELLNKSSGSDTDATVDLPEASTTCDKIPNSLFSFVDNYDKIPEKKEEEPKFVYDEVVRGNARKQLKGWSCKECENYYQCLNLPPDELEEKKNACSRHRHKFKPRDETYAGFWDLTFKPTPESPDSEKSLIFNYKK